MTEDHESKVVDFEEVCFPRGSKTAKAQMLPDSEIYKPPPSNDARLFNSTPILWKSNGNSSPPDHR